MFKLFRALVEALQGVVHALIAVSQRLESGTNDALEQRVQALETSRAVFEGELHGAMLKVEARFNAARAAEERVRVKTRRRGAEDDESSDFGPEAEAAAAQLAEAYAARGGANGVHAVSTPLEADPRATIRARKWGRT